MGRVRARTSILRMKIDLHLNVSKKTAELHQYLHLAKTTRTSHHSTYEGKADIHLLNILLQLDVACKSNNERAYVHKTLGRHEEVKIDG